MHRKYFPESLLYSVPIRVGYLGCPRLRRDPFLILQGIPVSKGVLEWDPQDYDPNPQPESSAPLNISGPPGVKKRLYPPEIRFFLEKKQN